MGASVLLGAVVLGVALGIGMVGYHGLENMSWIDAFANASMILSGMGPLTPLATNAGKLFAGSYALFSGLVFIAVAGILLAPGTHRLLHRFHLDNDPMEPETGVTSASSGSSRALP